MNILLGVCGSISAYKSYDILRSLLKEGHEVRVICTKGSLNFIIPQVFLYLGASKVYNEMDDFNYPNNQNNNSSRSVLHIELSKWTESFSVAPLSANTLSSLAHGLCPDLLTSVFLALPRETPVNLFPAMNTSMYTHPFTKENIDLLQKIKGLKQVRVHLPESGLLACGDIGEGKLPDPEKISDCIDSIDKVQGDKSKNILITTGATLAPLDPVRYLTNASSGLTGYYLASNALKKGHRVCVIAGKNATSKLNHLVGVDGFELIKITTTEQMCNKVLERIDNTDIYLTPAAISDIKFTPLKHKLKKSELTNSLKIENSVDILKEVLKKKRQDQKIIGFAAETDLTDKVLQAKFISKPVDLLIGTKVYHDLGKGTSKEDEEIQGFKNDSAFYKFYENEKISYSGTLTKKKLAELIFKRVLND